MPQASFSQTCRLKNNSAFKAVIDRRLRLSDGLLTIYAAPNGLEYSRLGISVGRSCGGAVRRNALKRLVREVWRQSQARIPQAHDYVVMMTKKNQPFLPTYEEVDRSFAGLMAGFRVKQERQ
jgi:ribonuclease P protein component